VGLHVAQPEVSQRVDESRQVTYVHHLLLGTEACGKKTPHIIDAIKDLMKDETAGDPITGLKWTRKTTEKIADELGAGGVDVSARTVCRLLKKLKFSLRVNRKQLSNCTAHPEQRNRQFENIAFIHLLCDRHNLSVTVAHYPSGCSKWNPVERQLFSRISANWKGVPLKTYETALNHIRTTKTKTGLRVKAYLVRKLYSRGQKISDEQMGKLNLIRDEILPLWNYTLRPSPPS
jgi:hypothetical protein